MSLTIDLPPQDEQTEFNLRRWEDILADPEWQKWPGRVETDRHGYVILSPPASFNHGRRQSRIGSSLEQLLPEGVVAVECPISIRDGVRAADVAWISNQRLQELGENICLTGAPEICVEVVSPKNSARELAEKKALCFAAGAVEVWFCQPNGTMLFFLRVDSPGEKQSRLCPHFPGNV